MEFQQAMISVTAGEISDTYSLYIIGINIEYIFNKKNYLVCNIWVFGK